MDLFVVFSLIFSILLTCYAENWRSSIKNGTSHEVFCSNKSAGSESDSWTAVFSSSSVESILNASQVINLKMRECSLDFVTAHLKSLVNLVSIDISNSQYASIGSFISKREHLMKFNASHNKLIEVPAELFTDTPEIAEIDFSFNNLTNIDAFINAEKLAKIHFTHNRIRNINEQAFAKLRSLELLDLRHNLIAQISFTLSKTATLKALHLEHNRLWLVDCHLFSLARNLTAVHLSWETVTALNTVCWDDELHVILTPVQHAIQPTQTDKLELHCSENSFENLNEFNAGHNRIDNALVLLECLNRNLKQLDLSGNYLADLTLNTFEKFVNLQNLYLSDTKLQIMDFEIFANQRELFSLDISRNSIQSVKNLSILAKMPIWDFNLADNHINNTVEIVRHLNPAIRILDLSGNDLSQLNASTFQNLVALEKLFIKNTNLTSFDVNPFERLDRLMRLDISFNNLQMFNFTVMSTTLKNIAMFHAAYCQIKQPLELIKLLNPYALELDLSGNTIGEMNADTFETVKLIRLELGDAKLLNFDFSILERLTELRFLNVSYNNLIGVNLSHLSNKLSVLQLEGNDLTEIENLTQSRFPKLFSLAIAKNQLSCRYLETLLPQLKREWSNLKLIGNTWNQRTGEKCQV